MLRSGIWAGKSAGQLCAVANQVISGGQEYVEVRLDANGDLCVLNAVGWVYSGVMACLVLSSITGT